MKTDACTAFEHKGPSQANPHRDATTRAHTPVCTHACAKQAHPLTQACIVNAKHTYTHKHTHACTHRQARTHAHRHKDTRMHAYSQTYTDTRARTRTPVGAHDSRRTFVGAHPQVVEVGAVTSAAHEVHDAGGVDHGGVPKSGFPLHVVRHAPPCRACSAWAFRECMRPPRAKSTTAILPSRGLDYAKRRACVFAPNDEACPRGAPTVLVPLEHPLSTPCASLSVS